MEITIPKEKMPWIDYRGRASTGGGSINADQNQRTFNGTDSIALLRTRYWEARPGGLSTVDRSAPTDGILFWLEPVENEQEREPE